MARKTQFPVLLHCSDSRFIREIASFKNLLQECSDFAAKLKHDQAIDYFATNIWALECIIYDMKRKGVKKAKRKMLNGFVRNVLRLTMQYVKKFEAAEVAAA